MLRNQLNTNTCDVAAVKLTGLIEDLHLSRFLVATVLKPLHVPRLPTVAVLTVGPRVELLP